MISQPTIAVLGSHSALDVCRGAKDEGFQTLVIAEKGREKTYSIYYKIQHKTYVIPDLGREDLSSHKKIDSLRQLAERGNDNKIRKNDKIEMGCVDECLVLDKFNEILLPKIQELLRKKNCIFIPNRSFEAYLNFDYSAIEKRFQIPIFGNRFLLKIEERGTRPNQYDLLDTAKIRYPKHFSDPASIDRLCLVKVSEKMRKFERAFFLANSFKEFIKKSQELKVRGKITKNALNKAVIEEFVVGAQVNFNFFYSPIFRGLELLGTDTRRQTNLDGILRLPAMYQNEILQSQPITYEEAGHQSVTVLESLLEKAFEMGEKFVTASQKLYPPGIIGPFALQTIITSGPPKKDIIVIDVSPRMPGSPGISATPYASYLYGQPLSVGKRVAMEIKQALKLSKLDSILT